MKWEAGRGSARRRAASLTLFALATIAMAGCSQPPPAAGGGFAAASAGKVDPAPAPSSDPPIPAAAAPAIASTRRDDRTLAAATPYQDRHGKTGCQAADCAQHEAGYKWAALHTLTEEVGCAGLTPAFVDGCRAYARDHSTVTRIAGAAG
jgi:hypothetical protein